MRFRDLTIKKKLTTALMVTSASAVLLACLGFYIFVMNRMQDSYHESLTSLARIINHNCQVALAFNIPEDAESVLNSLKTRSSIKYAAILDANGNIFAIYTANQEKTPKIGNSPPSATNSLVVQQDILLDDNLIGTLSIYDNMEPIKQTRSLMRGCR